MAGQVFGARMSETMSETNGNKFFFVGIQRRRLAAKVQPEEARFGPELDWGKLWRGQVFGELDAAFGSESTL